MQQFDLVHDDVWSALRGLVSACGGSKKVSQRLWPAKTKASEWLDDCLNPDRSAKLCIEEFFELLRMGREIGFHGAKHYIDDITMYERSQPAEPADELTQLLRVYLSNEQKQVSAKGRIDKLIDQVGLRAVR